MTGQDLKQIRKSLGLNVQAFASHLGLSPVTIYQMEQGRKRVTPRTELQIKRLCELFEKDSAEK